MDELTPPGIILVLSMTALLAGCHRQPKAVEPPPHATDTIAPPSESSQLAVPIEVDLVPLRQAVEDAVPRQLWSIDKHFDRCVAPQKVNIFGARIPVTPKLGCTVVGSVTRGPVTLHGAKDGNTQDIVADLPINAVVQARDVGGIIKSETATAQAMAHARLRLAVRADWSLSGTARLTYDWKTPPGIDFLGQRILFTDKADEKLKPVIAGLEKSLPRQLTKVDLRKKVAGSWENAFAVLPLNGERPPVWMRITPQAFQYGGYAVSGQKLRLKLGVKAVTETFVGTRPADPVPTPLPGMTPLGPDTGLRLFMPVVAQYDQLEPVIQRALVKRARRPFILKNIGPVLARFDSVTAYGTTGGRIAVGLRLAARPQHGTMKPIEGLVWLTAQPVNQPGTRIVSFRDMVIVGETDRLVGDLLLGMANNPDTAATIAGALTQNFDKDFEKLKAKVSHAIRDRRKGAFHIQAQLDKVETGELRATGQGLYLPVEVTGGARVRLGNIPKIAIPRGRKRNRL